MKQIDYSPLDQKTPEIIKTTQTDLERLNPVLGSLFVFVIVAGLFTPLLALIPVIIIPFWLTLGWLVYKHVYLATFYMVRISNFAVKNNFRFAWRNFMRLPQKSVLAENEKSPPRSSIVNGQFNGYDFRFYNLLRFTLRGFYIVLEVDLKESYPHILLDSRANKKLAIKAEEAMKGGSLRKVEHQFNKHFDVYSNTDNVATLQVVEPSLMQAMLDSSLYYDVEIVDDKLYLISRFGYLDGKKMQYLFDAASNILNNLDRAPLA